MAKTKSSAAIMKKAKTIYKGIKSQYMPTVKSAMKEAKTNHTSTKAAMKRAVKQYHSDD